MHAPNLRFCMTYIFQFCSQVRGCVRWRRQPMSRAVERKSLQQQSASSPLGNANRTQTYPIWRRGAIQFLAKCCCTAWKFRTAIGRVLPILFPRVRYEAALKRSIYTFDASTRAQHHSCGPSWLRWDSRIAVALRALGPLTAGRKAVVLFYMERMRTTFQ